MPEPNETRSQPLDVEASLRAAHRLLTRLAYRDALAIYEVILEKAPDSREALLKAGQCLMALKRPQDAAVRFKAALPAAKDDAQKAQILCAWGQALDAAGDERAALDAFAKATLACGDVACGWFGHGSVSLRLGDWREAERSLDESYRLSPDGETAMLRGFARLGLGKNEEARADLRAALKMQPELRPRIERIAKGRIDL